MDGRVRDRVRSRAGNRCEYCRLRQDQYRFWRHQIEHVIAKKHGGSNNESNLALACIRCNLGKSSNLSGVDQVTGAIVPLFNPRTQHWFDHFEYQGAVIAGRTPTGRATVEVLNMNERERLELRSKLLTTGELD